MYEYISGKFIEKNPAYFVIDCNGIGYFIHVSVFTYSRMQHADQGRLLIHQVIREDAQLLFGFADEAERSLFRQLIAVSGIGANTARVILSSLSTAELHQAILAGNVPLLQSIKGIGLKTAQRIVIELKDKLGKQIGLPGEKLDFMHNTGRDEALSALIMLGFNKLQAEKALDKVLRENGRSQSVEDLVKNTLKIL